MMSSVFLRSKKLIPYFFILPALAFIAAIYLYPIMYIITLSFSQATFKGIQRFVGLANYQNLLSSHMVEVATRTAIFIGVSVPLAMFFGLLAALLLNQKFKGQNILRALACIPWFTPQSIAAVLWAWMIHPAYGMVNNMLLSMGVIKESISFLTVDRALSVCIAMRVWRASPFAILSLVAALQSIPADLYDAGRVDGASKRQTLLYITLPLIKPVFLATMLVMTLFTMITFDMVWVLTQGGPMGATEIVSITIYRQAFRMGNIGGASSVAVAVVGVLFLLTFVHFRYRR